MAILEAAIYTLLSGDAAVSAVTSTRIYPVLMPQNPTLPAITYTRVSGGQKSSLDGYSNLENPRIQVDVWGITYSSVKDLAAKVRAAMDGATTFRATIQSDTDFFEDDTRIYRVSMDFSVWFNTA